MNIIYTPQRSNRRVDYALEGRTLRITEKGETIAVDIDNLPEEHNYPIIQVTSESVMVIRFYGDDEKELFETPTQE